MGIDWVTFFAQIVNLFVLVWLLKKFLYHPVLQAVEKRQNEIMNKINRAKEEYDLAKNEHTALLKKHAEFDASKQQKFDEALQEVEAYKTRQITDIQNEIAYARQKMQDDLNRQTQILHVQIRDMLTHNFIKLSQKMMTQISGTHPFEQTIQLFKNNISNLSKTDIKKIKSSYKKQSVVIINSSETLTLKAQEDLALFLSKMFQWDLPLKMKFDIDENLILGLEMTIDDVCVQWSLKEYLDEYQQNLNHTLSALIVKE